MAFFNSLSRLSILNVWQFSTHDAISVNIYFFSYQWSGRQSFSVIEALAFLISVCCWSADRNQCSGKLGINPSWILHLYQFTLRCLPILSSINLYRKRRVQLRFWGWPRYSRRDNTWLFVKELEGEGVVIWCYYDVPPVFSLLVKI